MLYYPVEAFNKIWSLGCPATAAPPGRAYPLRCLVRQKTCPDWPCLQTSAVQGELDRVGPPVLWHWHSSSSSPPPPNYDEAPRQDLSQHHARLPSTPPLPRCIDLRARTWPRTWPPLPKGRGVQVQHQATISEGSVIPTVKASSHDPKQLTIITVYKIKRIFKLDLPHTETPLCFLMDHQSCTLWQ